MRDLANESSGDGSEDGDPVLVARRKQGEARRAEMGTLEPAAWLTGSPPSRKGKRAAIDGEAPGSRGRSSDLAHGASEDVGQQEIHRVCVMSTDLVVNDAVVLTTRRIGYIDPFFGTYTVARYIFSETAVL